jgi:hypothetical protein
MRLSLEEGSGLLLTLSFRAPFSWREEPAFPVVDHYGRSAPTPEELSECLCGEKILGIRPEIQKLPGSADCISPAPA